MNNQLLAIIINQITKGWVTKDSKGNAVSAELAASGTAGNIGKINLIGFTV